MLVHVTLLRLVNYFIHMGFSIPHLAVWPKLCVLSLKIVYLKALAHYNVLANVCWQMKNISSTLTYAEIELKKVRESLSLNLYKVYAKQT